MYLSRLYPALPLAAALLVHASLARAGVPLIESVDCPGAYPGASVHLTGTGFGEVQGASAIALDGVPEPGPATYWSDQLVIFTLPYRPGQESVEIQVLRDLIVPSNPVPLALEFPAAVHFATPRPGIEVRGPSLRVRVAPEFDHGQVTSVAFDYRVPPDLGWTPFAVDGDGAGPHYGTTVGIGPGDGWSATLDIAGLPEGPLEIRATAADLFGQSMTGTALYVHDPTPLAPRLLDGPILAASRFDEDPLETKLEFTAAEIESLLLVLFPIRWHYRRALTHADQDTMGIKDRNGNDVSDQACGPVAVAACLKWFGARFPALDKEIQKLAKELARRAGTDSSGTEDAALVAAIKALLRAAGLDPDQWQVTLQADSSKVYRSMIEGLNRDGFDKIMLLQQRSKLDVNGDGVVDSTDVVGHFVTLSSRGSRYRDVTITEPPPGQHFKTIESYVDFMNPATGETEEYKVDTAKQPPRIVGMSLADSTKGDPWVASVLCVRPPPPPIATGPEQLPGTIVASFPVPGPGEYSFSLPGSALPPGPSLLSFVGKAADGSEAADFSTEVVITGFCDVQFDCPVTGGNPPLTITWNNTSAPTDSVLAWEWDFDGDGVTDATGADATWVYTTPGVYTVALRALNAHGVDEAVTPGMIHVGGAAAVDPRLAAVTMLRDGEPNPFRVSTLVRFALARGGPTRLEVFGVDGRRVRTLVRRGLEAGEHAVRWDGADDRGRALAPGLYFIRLESAEGERRARRVVLAR